MSSKGTGVAVLVKPGESIDSALKRFKIQVEKAGVLESLQRASYYLKPSAAKKEKASRKVRTTYEPPVEEFYE